MESKTKSLEPVFSETTTAAEPSVVPVFHEAPKPARRIVKLAGGPTMWLLEGKKCRPITSSSVAAALEIPVEVVAPQELAKWAEGEAYSGA